LARARRTDTKYEARMIGLEAAKLPKRSGLDRSYGPIVAARPRGVVSRAQAQRNGR
jgi:hypothetical protein